MFVVVSKAMHSGFLVCNGKRVSLDHEFTVKNMIHDRSVLGE